MSMNRSSSMQSGLIDSVTLTFYLLTQKEYHFEYIPRSFSIPSLNTLRSFVSELCCGQSDKQTDRPKQTDSKYLPTPTDIVGVGNNILHCVIYSKSLCWWSQKTGPRASVCTPSDSHSAWLRRPSTSVQCYQHHSPCCRRRRLSAAVWTSSLPCLRLRRLSCRSRGNVCTHTGRLCWTCINNNRSLFPKVNLILF